MATRRAIASVLLTLGLTAGVVLVASLGGGSIQSVATLATINLVLVLGTYVFVGNSGVLSFGQMAFAAVGAYTAGLLRMPVADKAVFLPNLPGWLADSAFTTVSSIIIGGLVAAAIAMVLAVPLMRLSGISASLASLSLLFIVQVVARSWDDVTRGSQGLTPLPIAIKLGDALIWALAVIVLVFGYQLLSRGLLLRTSREDAVAAQSVGVNVGAERSVAFVLSAFVCGLGGGLYALFLGSVDPNLFFMSVTFLVITMLVIGGTGSVGGAVVGTIVVSLLVELLRRAQTGDLGFIQIPSRAGTQNLVLAVILFLIIVWRPDGLTGGRELSLGRFARGRRRTSRPAQPSIES